MTSAMKTTDETVYTRMSKLLDVKITSEIDAVVLVRRGISSRSYKRVAGKLKLSLNAVLAGSSERRRLATGARLSTGDSDRLLRIVRTYAEVAQLFNDEQMAVEFHPKLSHFTR